MKQRTLDHQFIYAINNCVRIGHSKRSEGTSYSVHSFARADELKSTGRDFGRWMKSAHPEIKLLRNVTSDHISEWLSQKNGLSRSTIDEYISRFNKLENIANNQFGGCSFSDGIIAPAPARDYIRDKAMTPEHISMLRQSFDARDARTDARIALEVTARTGLRAHEVANLQGSQIDLQRGVLARVERKGGKIQDVPIRDKDRAYFAALKFLAGDGRVCPHVSRGHKGGVSLDTALRREMKRLGIDREYENTSLHAVRKAYTLERMRELTGRDERLNPLTNADEKAAWQIVQKELGHGEAFRMELYKTYTATK